MREYWDLFWAFAKVGVMTFGGGYAMLPILQRELVDQRQWVTEEELMDYFAIGQCTPGIIAVNTATFIGQKRGGSLGGIASTLGVIFPSMVIISLLAGLIANFSHLAWVQNAFAGIQVAVSLLIVRAGWTMIQKMLKKSKAKAVQAAICTVSCAALVLIELFDLSFSSIWMLVIGGALGWLLFHQIKIDKKGGSAK